MLLSDLARGKELCTEPYEGSDKEKSLSRNFSGLLGVISEGVGGDVFSEWFNV